MILLLNKFSSPGSINELLLNWA